MIVVMVPPPPPRPPRREPRPTPSFLEPTPSSIDDAMRGTDPRMGLSRADVELGNRRGGEMLLAPISTLVDEAARQGVAPESALGRGALGAGAFVADLVNPTAWAAGAPIDKAIDLGVSGVQAYRALGPEQRALYNAMVRGLYHGSRNTGANLAKPFAAVNREMGDWRQNWFGGDLFGTASRKLGDQYANSSTRNSIGRMPPGVTAEGYPVTRGARFRLSEPLSSVGQRKILDLTGRTLDEADPVLYQRLVAEFGDPDDPLDFAKELAKMDLTGSAGMGRGLHQSSFSQDVRPILEESGYDTIRHLSGQTAQGDIVSPVYAFLRPQGIRATPTLPSPSRAMDMTDVAVGQGLGRVFGPVDEAITKTGAAVREGGESFADSLASVLRREDPSVLPTPIRNFVERRTGPVFRGENFPDVRDFNSNPALIALLKRLGLGGLFPDAPTPPSRMTPGAFSGDL